jgi:hypothetical protein
MALSSYHVGSIIQADASLRKRVAACAQEQGDAASIDLGDPEVWAEEHSWEYAMAPGWVAKVESALVSGILDWGNDPSVLSDSDILSWTQPVVTGG